MAVLAESVSLVYLAAGLISIGFVFIGIRRRDRPGSRGFVIFSAGVTLWSLGLAVPKSFEGVPYSLAFFYAVMLAAQLVIVGWLILVLEFTGRWPLSRPGNVAIGLFVLVGQLAVWSNPRHELLLGPQTEVMGAILVPDFGPVFWTLISIEYLIIGGCTAIIWGELRGSSGVRRTQALLIFLSTFPPVVASLVAITEFGVTNHDVTPFGFLVSEGLFALGLYRAQFLDIVPIARKVVIEEMEDAVLTVNDEHNLVDYNRAAAVLFGLDEAAIGRPISAVITHDGLLELITGEGDSAKELTIQNGDETVHVHVTVSELDVPGARDSRVSVLRDITPLKVREAELRQREAELERHNERLDEFAGVLSHDLRNPLNVAEGRLELVAEDCDSEHLDSVDRALDRMEVLIEDTLTLARAGESVGDLESVVLPKLAEECWRTIETTEANLRIDSEAVIQADESRLRQLLENLFSNAVVHGGDNVTVTIGDHDDGIYVADDGLGIQEDEWDRLFESGYSTAEEGTGLGLSIIQEIAEAHGWTIDIKSSEAGGARFEITGVEFAN